MANSSRARRDGSPLTLQDIERVIPADAAVILVNEDQWDGSLIAPHVVFPFLERDEDYWRPPKNDRVAVAELERLRRLGAHYIVFSWQAFQWLNHYSRLRRYLRSNCRRVLENDRVRVFVLPPMTTSERSGLYRILP